MKVAWMKVLYHCVVHYEKLVLLAAVDRVFWVVSYQLRPKELKSLLYFLRCCMSVHVKLKKKSQHDLIEK